jgi:hypothetical protein
MISMTYLKPFTRGWQMSRNGIASAREPGKVGRFPLTMHNDLFNAINGSAFDRGRGIGAEIVHRLQQSLVSDDAIQRTPLERADREAVAMQKIESVGRLLGAAFVTGIAQSAQNHDYTIAAAYDNLGCFIDALAAMVRQASAVALIEGRDDRRAKYETG